MFWLFVLLRFVLSKLVIIPTTWSKYILIIIFSGLVPALLIVMETTYLVPDIIKKSYFENLLQGHLCGVEAKLQWSKFTFPFCTLSLVIIWTLQEIINITQQKISGNTAASLSQFDLAATKEIVQDDGIKLKNKIYKILKMKVKKIKFIKGNRPGTLDNDPEKKEEPPPRPCLCLLGPPAAGFLGASPLVGVLVSKVITRLTSTLWLSRFPFLPHQACSGHLSLVGNERGRGWRHFPCFPGSLLLAGTVSGCFWILPLSFLLPLASLGSSASLWVPLGSSALNFAFFCLLGPFGFLLGLLLPFLASRGSLRAHKQKWWLSKSPKCDLEALEVLSRLIRTSRASPGVPGPVGEPLRALAAFSELLGAPNVILGFLGAPIWQKWALEKPNLNVLACLLVAVPLVLGFGSPFSVSVPWRLFFGLCPSLLGCLCLCLLRLCWSPWSLPPFCPAPNLLKKIQSFVEIFFPISFFYVLVGGDVMVKIITLASANSYY